MSLLIVCDPADVHVSALVWALHGYGVEPAIWSPAPPWVAPGSARFESSQAPDYRFPAKGGDIARSSIDAVWMRRWPRPNFPESFGEGDKLAARNELAAFHRGALELLPKDMLWANALGAANAANYKQRQLAAAQTVDLAIPRTLVTDDAAQARDFVTSFPEGEVIYKPFHTFYWERPGKLFYTVTTPVAEADFDNPEQLVWSPGIFQEFVPKAYELRVSVFGRTCVSAMIFDQDPTDWRTRQFDMKVAPYTLPESVEQRIHALMDELGLVMGMIDLIVTPEGDYVFLEVNEQGQFLWVEAMCPEVPMLDVAARFFASGNARFRNEGSPSDNVRYADFLKSPAFEEAKREEEAFVAAGGVHNSLVIKDGREAEAKEQHKPAQ